MCPWFSGVSGTSHAKVLAYVLMFGLIASIAGSEYGRDEAGQVMLFAEDVSITIGFCIAP